MMNLFTIQTLQLSRQYVSSHKHSHDYVLEKLVSVAYHNGGHLPKSFSLPMKYGSKAIINEVLEDLGYPPVNTFYAFKESVYVIMDI